jgi:hypothetical protein
MSTKRRVFVTLGSDDERALMLAVGAVIEVSGKDAEGLENIWLADIETKEVGERPQAS